MREFKRTQRTEQEIERIRGLLQSTATRYWLPDLDVKDVGADVIVKYLRAVDPNMDIQVVRSDDARGWYDRLGNSLRFDVETVAGDPELKRMRILRFCVWSIGQNVRNEIGNGDDVRLCFDVVNADQWGVKGKPEVNAQP